MVLGHQVVLRLEEVVELREELRAVLVEPRGRHFLRGRGKLGEIGTGGASVLRLTKEDLMYPISTYSINHLDNLQNESFEISCPRVNIPPAANSDGAGTLQGSGNWGDRRGGRPNFATSRGKTAVRTCEQIAHGVIRGGICLLGFWRVQWYPGGQSR